jgi:acyl carrier protein
VLHGIFQLAGTTGQSVVHLVADGEPEQVNAITNVKAQAARNIERAMEECNPDFVVQFSSTAAALGGVGLSSYGGANAVVETAASVNRLSSSHTKWISVAWDAWLTARYTSPGGLPPALREFAVHPEDAIKALLLLLKSGIDGPLIVSTGDMNARYRRSVDPQPPAPRPYTVASASDPSASLSHLEPYIAPASELEQTIATAWQEHLGVARVGRDDKFFELGGNSLLALRIVSRLKKELGIRVPVISVFEGASVRGMAELLSAEKSNEDLLEGSRNRGAARRRRLEENPDEGVLVN